MMKENGEVVEERALLSRVYPIISVANAILTSGFIAAIVIWAIQQEKSDATHTTRIEAQAEVIKRLDRDIVQNRNDIQDSLKDIRNELREMNQRLREREMRESRRPQ
jgi:gas vesicle protein